MKGGKRLSEEERFRLRQLLFVIAREPDGEEKNIAISESLSIVERDDEPEYCTCGSSLMYLNGKCARCGKPVKEE